MDERNLTIEKKLKALARGGAIAAFIVGVALMVSAMLSTDMNAVQFGIGLGIAAFLSVCFFAGLNSVAKKNASEITRNAGSLAEAASAMAMGDFSATFRTSGADELGQIEGALAQLLLVQKEFCADVNTLAKGSTADANAYAGEYRAVISALSDALKTQEKSAATASAELVELRRELETAKRGLSEAESQAKVSVSAAESAKSEAEAARREAADAREDAATSRREATAANSEAANARRDASTARREADRATSQLKSMQSFSAARPPGTPLGTRSAPATVSARPATATAPTRPTAPPRPAPARPAPARPVASPARPASQLLSSVAKLRSGDNPSQIKSVKINAPSGAHEYDKRDFGKY